MVTYELNLPIKKDIFAEYIDWLSNHNVETLLENPGLFKAQIWEEENKKDREYKYIKVHYSAKSLDYLEDFLKDYIELFPKPNLKLFTNIYKIKKKILTQLHEIDYEEESQELFDW